MLTEDDLKRANPKATQTVNILGFVNADEIDITYFVKPFYLAPIGSGKKGYALLRAVLRDTARVAIAKVVIRTREYLCAVFARGDVLVLETLALRLRAARYIRARPSRGRPPGARPDPARDHHGRAVDRGHGHSRGNRRPTETSTATTCSG